MTDQVYTVEALTARIGSALTSAFPMVWVRGEVSNLSLPQSGHIYFTLKDAAAQLQCVWFAGRQRAAGRTFDPLTGEVYDKPKPAPRDFMRNGLELVCAGAIEVYQARGQYQLVVEMAGPAGAGLLAAELERRKAALAAKGYFARERKRPLPPNPARVALITSPHGAAIHDFLKVSKDRGLSSVIRLFPVLVQGPDAAAQVAEAIVEANTQNWAQVIVIIRGGGSLEDLWAFNEEIVADAIFFSRMPVLAGIGHEVDTSLADMTADARAATPTHAAQLLWNPQHDLWQNLDNAQMALDRRINSRLEEAEREYVRQSHALRLLSPARKLGNTEERLQGLMQRLRREITALMDQRNRRVEQALAVWGKAPRLRQSLAMAAAKTARLSSAAPAALARSLLMREKELAAKIELLESLNPYAPLRRGYAMLFADDGKLIGSARRAAPGQSIEALLGDGRLRLQTLAVELEQQEK